MSATTTTPTRQTQIVESIFIDPGLVRLALLAVMGPIVRVCMCKHVHPKYTNTPQENGIKTLSNRPSSCPIVFLLIFCLFFFPHSLRSTQSLSLSAAEVVVKSRVGMDAPLHLGQASPEPPTPESGPGGSVTKRCYYASLLT